MAHASKRTVEPDGGPGRWPANLALGIAVLTALGGAFAAIAALRQVEATYVSQRFAKQSDTVADFLAEVIRYNEVRFGASNAGLYLSKGVGVEDKVFDELKRKSGDQEMAILSAGVKAQFALPPDYENLIRDVEDDVDLIDIAIQNSDALDAPKRASNAGTFSHNVDEDSSRLDADLKPLRYCAYQGLKGNRPIEDGTVKTCADNNRNGLKTR